MRKLQNILIPFISSVAVVIIVLLALKPVRLSRENAVVINATVKGVSKGGLKDVIISLYGIRGIYYINKGIEKGFNVDSLNKKLKDKNVVVFYLKPGILPQLNPMTDKRQIVELKLGQESVYSEF